jgi:L-fuconolactonase
MAQLRIDAHQHFWSMQRDDYTWMSPDLGVLYQDYLPPDLEPIIKKHNIDKTVLVQAADTEAEADFMLGLAEEYDFIAGVVAYLDLDSPGFPQRLAHYRQHPKFKGIRPLLEFYPDDDWMLRPQVKESFKLLAREGICFDFVSHPQHLPCVIQVLDETPGLRAVIDHISKPLIADGTMEPWSELMGKVAAHQNVYCKLSGMITEADHQSWKPSDLKPYIQRVVELFGPGRLMFGSDWPVCKLAGGYDRAVEALMQNLEGLASDEIVQIFGETAQRFYRL